MVRSILTLSLLVAFALPLVSADPLAGANLSLPSVPIEEPAPMQGVVSDTVGTVTGAAGEVQELLECRTAVRVHLVWYGAQVTDERAGATSFLADKDWVETRLERVAVVQKVREQVGTTLDELGVLQPVFGEVERVTGYDVREIVTPHNVKLAVIADWNEEYLTWDTYESDILVTLPVGLPLVATGEGEIEQVCDPNAQILTYIPDPAEDEVDYWCVNCDAQPADGWATRVLSVDVHVASPEEMATLPHGDDNGRYILCPTDVLATITAKIEAFVVTVQDEADQKAAYAKYLAQKAAGEPAPAVEPAAGETSFLASNATSLGLLALAAVVVAGVAVVLARRTK